MNKLLSAIIISAALLLSGCQQHPTENTDPTPTIPTLGSSEWQNWIDKNVQSGDGQGHGPDIGSQEWCGTIDHRLFRGGTGMLPCSDAWNQKVTDVVTDRQKNQSNQ